MTKHVAFIIFCMASSLCKAQFYSFPVLSGTQKLHSVNLDGCTIDSAIVHYRIEVIDETPRVFGKVTWLNHANKSPGCLPLGLNVYLEVKKGMLRRWVKLPLDLSADYSGKNKGKLKYTSWSKLFLTVGEVISGLKKKENWQESQTSLLVAQQLFLNSPSTDKIVLTLDKGYSLDGKKIPDHIYEPFKAVLFDQFSFDKPTPEQLPGIGVPVIAPSSRDTIARNDKLYKGSLAIGPGFVESIDNAIHGLGVHARVDYVKWFYTSKSSTLLPIGLYANVGLSTAFKPESRIIPSIGVDFGTKLRLQRYTLRYGFVTRYVGLLGVTYILNASSSFSSGIYVPEIFDYSINYTKTGILLSITPINTMTTRIEALGLSLLEGKFTYSFGAAYKFIFVHLSFSGSVSEFAFGGRYVF